MILIKRDQNKGYLDTWLWIPKSTVNVGGVKNALTFVFPDTYSPQKIREVFLYREAPHHLLVPRAFWNISQVPYEVVDCRPQKYKSVSFKSRIKLDHRMIEGSLHSTGDDVQQQAMKSLLSSSGGVLQLACGKGKTVVFLELAARIGVPTLIIVDNTHLLEQWEEEIHRHLDVPGGLGYIQGGQFDWKKNMVLATYHSVANKAGTLPEEARRWFGLIGWDEGHHISAPTFAASADLFYGKRIALTATPVRDDGTHIIYDLHIGPVVYKDLTQEIKPSVIFKWTGMDLNETDPDVQVRDKNKQVHLSKVYSYYGRWRKRLHMILKDVQEAIAEGRKKVLVLSYSISTVSNLLAMWIFGPNAFLYTDIPEPLPEHVGETLQPEELTKKKRTELTVFVEQAKKQLKSGALNPIREQNLRRHMHAAELKLEQDRVHQKIQTYWARIQKWYVKELRKFITDAGIMIHDVPARTRAGYVNKCRVVFAIMKYGKEGLDAPDLDTVIVAEPFSSRNGLQQLMGRTTRVQPGKRQPVILVYEDSVGPIIGMCNKLRKHLRDWPHEEGGPFDYEMYLHPNTRNQWTNKTTSIFGR